MSSGSQDPFYMSGSSMKHSAPSQLSQDGPFPTLSPEPSARVDATWFGCCLTSVLFSGTHPSHIPLSPAQLVPAWLPRLLPQQTHAPLQLCCPSLSSSSGCSPYSSISRLWFALYVPAHQPLACSHSQEAAGKGGRGRQLQPVATHRMAEPRDRLITNDRTTSHKIHFGAFGSPNQSSQLSDNQW